MTVFRQLFVIIGLALCLGVFSAPGAMAQPSAPAPAANRPALPGDRLSSAASYVPQPSLMASITNSPRGRAQILVDFGLDVPDAALRARVQALSPRIRDALRGALSDYVISRFRPGTAPDPEQISRMLQMSLDRMLGRPGARVLLINVMYQGPMG